MKHRSWNKEEFRTFPFFVDGIGKICYTLHHSYHAALVIIHLTTEPMYLWHCPGSPSNGSGANLVVNGKGCQEDTEVERWGRPPSPLLSQNITHFDLNVSKPLDQQVSGIRAFKAFKVSGWVIWLDLPPEARSYKLGKPSPEVQLQQSFGFCRTKSQWGFSWKRKEEIQTVYFSCWMPSVQMASSKHR